ncbi:MAG: PilN domain-containing protein [Nitrospira sp.]
MTSPTVFSRRAVGPAIPPIRLSVAPETIRLIRLLQWALLGITGLAWALAGWWGWTSQAVEAEAVRYALAANRTEELNRQFTAQMRRDQLTLTPQQIAAIKHDVVFINQLADKRAFSWTQLLSDLEEAVPPGTSIGKIQLDMKDSSVRFDGLARHMHDVNALMANLQTRPAFSHPVLHHHTLITAEPSHTRPRDEDAADVPLPVGVEFALTVIYRLPEQEKGARS